MVTPVRESTFKADRVVAYGPEIGPQSEGGIYALSMQSGLITTIAAHTASAGQLAAFRWSSDAKICLVQRIVLDLCMVTDFTTVQRFNLGVRIARSYSASHSGGTAATLTGNNCKKRASYATTLLGDFRIATTTALTTGTQTFDDQPFLTLTSAPPSDGATVHNIPARAVFDGSGPNGPLVLAQNEGFVVSNEILMGAAGTAVLGVSVEWREVESYPQ
jgi:hypothetical protein